MSARARHDTDTDRLPSYRWHELTCFTCAYRELALLESARPLDQIPPFPCRRFSDGAGVCRGLMTPRIASAGPRVHPLAPPAPPADPPPLPPPGEPR